MASDNLVGGLLLDGGPLLDLVQNVDGGAGEDVRMVGAQHVAVHPSKIDGRDGEGAVHIEDHPAQAP